MNSLKLFLIYAIQVLLMQNIHAQNAETVVQRNLNAYNNRDLMAFMNDFSDDIVLVNFNDGKVLAEGKQAVENLYSDLFNQSPNLHSTVLKRIVIGNKVIDHESIIGRRGSSEPVELVMIYEIRDEKIFKMTVIRP